MASKKEKVEMYFNELCKQPTHEFPKLGTGLDAPTKKGVYVIRKGKDVLHVGMTPRARYGIWQRLQNHLAGQSSFVGKFLKDKREALRKGCAYQSLVVENDELRARLEIYATARLWPKHIGLGEQ